MFCGNRATSQGILQMTLGKVGGGMQVAWATIVLEDTKHLLPR